jgi:hypothetical protein
MGVKLQKMPILQEAIKRGLGEGDVEKIQILGASIEAIKEKLRQRK